MPKPALSLVAVSAAHDIMCPPACDGHKSDCNFMASGDFLIRIPQDCRAVCSFVFIFRS